MKQLYYDEIKNMKVGEIFTIGEHDYEMVEDALFNLHFEWETEVITLRVKMFGDETQEVKELYVACGFPLMGPLFQKEIGE
jgi:hypothetical protein